MARKEKIPPNYVPYIREINLRGYSIKKTLYSLRIKMLTPSMTGGEPWIENRELIPMVFEDQLPFFLEQGIEIYKSSSKEF